MCLHISSVIRSTSIDTALRLFWFASLEGGDASCDGGEGAKRTGSRPLSATALCPLIAALLSFQGSQNKAKAVLGPLSGA